MLNIIIPVYNALDTIRDTLNSLLTQTKKMFIVTCVQDADGLDYTDIVKEYVQRGLQLRWLSCEKNGGPGVARQIGVDSETMCDTIMFLDADDMFYPDAVERAIAELKKTNADLVAFSFMCEQSPEPPLLMEADKIPCTWNHGKVYNRKYLERIGLRWREDLRLNEDSYFNLVAWNATQNKAFVRQPIYFWRNNQSSLTRINGTEGFFDRGYDQYILSQVLGLQKLVELDMLNAQLLAMTLCNIYDTYCHAMFKKLDLDSANMWLDGLRADAKIQELINTPDFWKTVSQNVKACDWYEMTLYFYKERFVDWLTRCVRQV